ncbi:hypothetical protein EV217_5115 [Phyllobacterium myrsinacearum]|nr:hypothetical protein EV217_5115 [Phyllobacterium myrsinacearum]
MTANFAVQILIYSARSLDQVKDLVRQLKATGVIVVEETPASLAQEGIEAMLNTADGVVTPEAMHVRDPEGVHRISRSSGYLPLDDMATWWWDRFVAETVLVLGFAEATGCECLRASGTSDPKAVLTDVLALRKTGAELNSVIE